MSDGEHIGKASVDLDVDLTEFDRNLDKGGRKTEEFGGQLGALAEIADLTNDALRRIHMVASQATETERVGGAIDRQLDQTKRKANETNRALDRVRLGGGRNGSGVGPFGSGYGRVGMLGTAIGAGTLAAPAAGPAALGLLAAGPVALAGLGGIVGTLALALNGVGKAIGGDKKAFDSLVPAQKQFVLLIRSMHDWIAKLKQTAGASLFPGLTAGLKSALSPGTMSAIATAVGELGKALGQAGAQWGKYFGSREFQSIFGPLMQAAARNIGVLSTVVLKLFDAFGVLGRAAIPFTNWLADVAARGATFIDTFVHAKDASGGLARGLNEAKTSLRLVAGLVDALFRAVGALGKALYPVSKIFVKDLTDALNALAGMINRNRDGIRRFVNGALTTAVGTIKDLVGLIEKLWPLVDTVVSKFGGWKTVIEEIVALKFASVIFGWSSALKVFLGGASAAGGTGLFGFMSRFAKFAVKYPKFFGPAAVVAAALIDTPHVATDGTVKGNPYIKGSTGFYDFIAGIKGRQADKTGHVSLDGIMPGGGLTLATSAAYKAGVKAAADQAQSKILGLVNAFTNAATTGNYGAAAAGPFGSHPPFTKNLGPHHTHTPTLNELGIGRAMFQIKQYVAALKTLAATDKAGQATAMKQIRDYVTLAKLLPWTNPNSLAVPSGVGFLTSAQRLAIDKSKGTPSKLDDLAAVTHARDALEKLAKNARDVLKVPIADELARLNTTIQSLRGNMDGFNLTLAEQRRHILDRNVADRYHARPATGEGAAVTYAPTYHVPDVATAKRKDKQDFFRFRVQMGLA